MTPARVPDVELSPAQFEARMASAREAGRPFFPWDDLSHEAWRRSLDAIARAMTAISGDSQRGRESDAAPLSRPIVLEVPEGPRALGIAAFTSGTGPLLAWWIETGALATDEDTAALLRLHLDHGRRRFRRLTEAFHHVVDLLAAVGVTPTLIKGFHTAHTLFPDTATRPMSDLDMVVASDQVATVTAALERAGFRRGRHLRRPYMAEWSPPGPPTVPRSLDLTHEANPWTLDLHASFARDFGGVRVVSPVPESTVGLEVTERLAIAEREVRVLRQPYLAAYLAAHASQELKNLTLLRLLELVWVTQRSASQSSDPTGASALDWTELAAVLVRQRAAAYVHPAFHLAEQLVPGTVPPDFQRLLEDASSPRVRRVIERLEPASAQRIEAVSLEEQFMWASGPLDHLRRIRRALWPSWAGSFAELVGVQTARARQLLSGRVSITQREPSARSRDERR